jgi:hypothetical protein
MQKIRKKKLLVRYIVLFVLVMTSISVLFIMYAIPEPPDQYVRSARENLSVAREAHADRYASDLYKQAGNLYDSAMALWQSENEKLLIFRDYDRVVRLADSASVIAVRAAGQAGHRALNVSKQTGLAFSDIQDRIKRISSVYGNLPLSDQFRDMLNQSKLLLEEARIARGKHEFHKAEEILERADKALAAAENIAGNRMKSYFEDYPVWEKLYNDAVDLSRRNNSVLIVVDKLAGELSIYREGRRRSTFRTEFGPNWLGDKNHQGDQATPEGLYHVEKKKERRQTRYYKALLLNYPNPDDLQRYKSNVKNGRIPSGVDVGGLIEIHGHGGQGFNWTNGCVALSDKDMDVVYRQSSVHTPVIIVGSLVPYGDWIENADSGH